MKSVKNVFAISFLILGFLVFTLILVSCNRDSEGFVFEESESTATVIGYKGRNEHITIPSSYNGKPVTAIGDSAFDINENKRVIKSVMIPSVINIRDDTVFIKDQAFAYNDWVKEIRIPISVLMIGAGAFNRVENLTDVYYEGTKKQWNNIKICGGNEPLLNATINYNE